MSLQDQEAETKNPYTVESTAQMAGEVMDSKKIVYEHKLGEIVGSSSQNDDFNERISGGVSMHNFKLM